MVFGTTVSGRPTELDGVEEMVGLFINTLPVRVRVPPEVSVVEWLRRLQAQNLGVREHEYTPLPWVQGWSEVARGTPLFESIVVFENYPVDLAAAPHAGLEVVPGASLEQGSFPLSLVAALRSELMVHVRYQRHHFGSEAVERLAGHLATVLETIAFDPEQRLGAVSLLRGTERARVLEEWNATAAELPGACVHELFAEQAARTPGSVAVQLGGRTLTYAELERDANRLAHHLVRIGVTPDVPVALCVERSLEMVVGILGVLKAGGAYLPLEPTYPAERMRLVLEDARAPVLLTQERVLPRLPDHAARVICLDRDWPTVLPEPTSPVAVGVTPRHLAYVIYTSGSTGAPKGVLVEHRGLTSYLRWFDRTVLGADGFALPLVSRISFDAHVRQLFPPLLRGEAVWVLPEGAVTDPRALLEAISGRERVSFGGVPSLWGAMLELVRSGEAPKPAGLKAVLLGGEVLHPSLAEHTLAVFPDVAVWNHYGPTEGTVNTTVARVTDPRRVSIGRPVANVRVYLLDGYGNPVPAGVPGELHVAGAGVSRGYLGMPALTAERFVPDPFSGEPGARMYRSSDRARWRADGELEYAGRSDFQVKVRGFRIELEEIEAVLRGHGRVREAVVLLREDVPEQAQLVAYVTAREGAEVSHAELREHLAERMPEYMVPGKYVVLERLPVTASGKIDRRALPAPEWTEAVGDVGPRTAVEELVAGIWAEVLGIERVGVAANFFEIGGHSLLATQVASRTRQTFGVEVPLRALFESPTVAGLAECIEALRNAGTTTPPMIGRTSCEGQLPLSFAQQRLWMVDRLEPGSATYNMPYALRLHGVLDTTMLRASLDELVRRHQALRTTFAESGGHPVQVVHGPVPVPLPVVDLRGLREAEQEAERLVREEALRPFSLSRGPLLRSTVLRIAQDDHVLCFTLHHIVSDGWSRGVLVREVSALYAAVSRGETAALPDLPVQYADYAIWQRARMSGEVLEAQIGYWKDRLAGAPPLLEVPTDHPRPPGQSPRGASHGFRLSPRLSGRLRVLSRREGTTLFMTLLAGWQALLARYAGQEDVVVGTPVAGRNRRETEGLIGFFVNMLAMRADLSGDPTWSGLLRQVRETALGAYDHQELPFERLVEELGVERSLTYAPVFQAVFTLNLYGGEGDRLDLGELDLEPFGGVEHVAKFDLDLVFADAHEMLDGALLYRQALFEAGTIARLTGHLEAVLEAMTSDPRRRLSELSLLRGAERAQVLEAWNATAAELPRACIHELFTEHASRTADAPAVLFRGEVLTYGELERRSNRFACLLRQRGVGPESRVGVCMERGIEVVAVFLGVLKAGGAYVPLDPSNPAARVREILADAGASLVLTHAAAGAQLPGDVEEIWLDDPETTVRLSAIPETMLPVA
ncbi:MAG TPA: amino acid adenylation domain-containing protein, partial [Longimicrobiaceae bacterium]